MCFGHRPTHVGRNPTDVQSSMLVLPYCSLSMVPCSCFDSVHLVDICLILMNIAYVGESCTLLQPQAPSESLTTQSVRCPANLRALRLEKARVCSGLFHRNCSHMHEGCELSPQPSPGRHASRLNLQLARHVHRIFPPKSK